MSGQVIKGPWRAVIRRNQHGLQNVAVDMAPLTSWRPSSANARKGAFPDYEEDVARLIAAAPDLLESLVDAQSVLAALIDPDNHKASVQAVFAQAFAAEVKARAAIAKARGECQTGA